MQHHGELLHTHCTVRLNIDVCADTPPWGDANVEFIAKMHLLQTLILARTYVGSVHLEVLGKLNQLKHLDLSHTMLANEALMAAKDALTGLEVFDVSYTYLVSPASTLIPQRPDLILSSESFSLCHSMQCSIGPTACGACFRSPCVDGCNA